MGAFERKKIRIEWWFDVVPAEAGNTEATYIVDLRKAEENDEEKAERTISTGWLNTLLCLHVPPIIQVVFLGPSGRVYLEGGFPLRCFQRLSVPHIATLQCRWRDNRNTRGVFIPVLSY